MERYRISALFKFIECYNHVRKRGHERFCFPNFP